jgi:hypothetical protein
MPPEEFDNISDAWSSEERLLVIHGIADKAMVSVKAAQMTPIEVCHAFATIQIVAEQPAIILESSRISLKALL